MDRAGSHSLNVSDVKEGDVLAGKYRIERTLGAGGMGVVVQAHHLQLDERVALKFLLPESARNAEVVERFAREARAAVKIKSEHVARVSDVGTLANGSPYMVMEYLEGCDLAALRDSGHRFSVAEAVEYVLQACEAIAEAHSLGIVHRDLKSANLFLVQRADGSPCIKVLDFGISKLSSLSGPGGSGSMTQTATILGSPCYMSPEQLSSAKDVDGRTDIWALGVILYELLTGSLPFEAENMAALCVKILQTSPPSLRVLRPDLSPELERAVLHTLERDRDRRYASVGELVRALAPFASDRARISVDRVAGIGPKPAPIAPVPMDPSQRWMPTQTADHGWGRSKTASRRPSKWGLVSIASVVLVTVVGILYYVASRVYGDRQAKAVIAAGEVSAAASRPPAPAIPIASETTLAPPLPESPPAGSVARDMAPQSPERKFAPFRVVPATARSGKALDKPQTTTETTPQTGKGAPDLLDGRR
jgi:eukaryotic-like serine/threonine-protein kinase